MDINFELKKDHKILWANCRGGYGRGIYHISCPECGYKLSGYMQSVNEDEALYIKDTISMYSDRNFIDVDEILKLL